MDEGPHLRRRGIVISVIHIESTSIRDIIFPTIIVIVVVVVDVIVVDPWLMMIMMAAAVIVID